jgi:hypothetical protein
MRCVNPIPIPTCSKYLLITNLISKPFRLVWCVFRVVYVFSLVDFCINLWWWLSCNTIPNLNPFKWPCASSWCRSGSYPHF